MNTKRTSFSVLFFIKKSKVLQNGEAPIYGRITYNGSRSDFSIKRTIPIDQWDQKSGSAKGRNQHNKNINNYLDQLMYKAYHEQLNLSNRDEFVTAMAIKNKMFGIDKENKMILEV